MPNLFEPDWEAERDEPPFRWRRARLGRQAGARQLGASLFELPPGAATFPLHAHYSNEELLVVRRRPSDADRARTGRSARSSPVRSSPARLAGRARTESTTTPTSRRAC